MAEYIFHINLDEFCSKKPNEIRIRSKCDWYGSGEKSNRFFLNLKKFSAAQSLIHTLAKNGKKIGNPIQKDIELQDFFSFGKKLKPLFSIQHESPF